MLLAVPSVIVIFYTVFNGESFQPSIILYMWKIDRIEARPSVSLIKNRGIALI